MSDEVRIADVMFTGDEVPVVKEADMFRSVLEVLDTRKLGVVCVLNKDGKLTGIVTDGDVRRIMLRTQDPLPRLFVESVESLMTTKPITIDLDTTINEALRLMNERLIWIVPVVDEAGYCVGLLHMQFALRAFIKSEAN